ncbi:MAG TPA: CHAT domain-containing protein, partial [Allocoleopsis sp.]
FLNTEFSLENLKTQRQITPYRIIHLGTHGEFKPGPAGESYIQLGDNNKLKLDEIKNLGWNNPPVDLLVLSACRTAVGDEKAELGFAGLAVAAGVRTAVGSLWYVSDEGTLGLMTTFYQKLGKYSTKAESLRQTQIDIIKGNVRIQNGQLITPEGVFPLPEELKNIEDKNISHPYFWSAFTMIGSPW